MKYCPQCGRQYSDLMYVCETDNQTLLGPVPDDTTPRHSKLGIASFIISLVTGGLMFATLVIAGLLHDESKSHGDPAVKDMVVGLVMLLLLAVDVVAAALGIAALFQSGTKRVFGILGLVFSLMILLGTVGIILLGMSMK